jgi:uncharacterized protein YyaL (SSP411 family)
MDAARTNAHFLLASMRRADGRWLRSWQDGTADILAYAEDYGALLEAWCTLAEHDGVHWLDAARDVADALLELFADTQHGGVFTTGSDAESLIVRPKDVDDNATPAANSLAANGLLRLAAFTGDEHYAAPARRWLAALASVVGEQPTAFSYLLGALDRAVHPSIEVAIVGEPSAPETRALARAVSTRLVPGAVHLVNAPGDGADRSPLLVGRTAIDGRATAYVCRDYSCELPVTDPVALGRQLDAAVVGADISDRR